MRRNAVVVVLLLALPLAAQQDEQPRTWTVLAPGIAAGPIFTAHLRTGPAVWRYYAIGNATAENFLNPGCDTIMRLEAGLVFTTIAGRRQRRLPGDFWFLEKRTRISFENPYPHTAAIIHVISFSKR